MERIKLFFEAKSAERRCNLIQIDDFVLRLPEFKMEFPFNDPLFMYSECKALIGETDFGMDDWNFPSALQAVKIQVNWFDILVLASKCIPFNVRWDRSDNPIWIWTSVFEDGKVFRFDVNSGDMHLCDEDLFKAYPCLVRNLNNK